MNWFGKQKFEGIVDLRANALFAAMLLALGGCSMGAPRAPSDGDGSASGGDGGATFQMAAPVEGSATAKSVNPQWLITTEQRFKFKACLTSTINGNAVAAHDFSILDDRGVHVASATTDPAGCLNWSEDVPFEPLASAPTYLTFVRRLKAEGRQRGSVMAEIGVNPWHQVIGDEPAVVDVSSARGTRLAKIAGAEKSRQILNGTANAGPAAQLYIPSVGHEYIRAKAGSGLTPHFQLTFRPVILAQTMSGGEVELPVKAGALLVKPSFLHTAAGAKAKGGPKLQLHKDLEAKRETVKNGEVLVELPIPFELAPNAAGFFELAMIAVPEAAPAGLEISDRLYTIGDHANLAKGTARLTNESKQRGFSTKSLEIVVAAKSDAPADRRSAILANPLTIAFAGMDYRGLKRDIRINFSTKLIDALSLRALEHDRKIEISALDPDGRALETETLPGGAIHWEDTLTHSAYAKHKRVVYTIRITDKATDSFTERKALLNLADPEGASFAFDLAVVGSRLAGGDVDPPAQSRFTPKLKINTVCMTRRPPVEYDLDHDLNLTIWNRYQLRLQSEVLRPDNKSLGLSAPSKQLLSGRYLVSLLVYRSGDIREEGALPVIVSQKVVDYEGGQFSAEILMPLNQLSLALLKNYLVVQVSPMKDELQAKPRADVEALLKRVDAGSLVERELGVQFPAHVTAFTPPAKDECIHFDSRENTIDARANLLHDQVAKEDLHSLASEHKYVTAPPKSAADEAQGWRASARRWKLQEHLLSRDADARELGLSAGLHDVAKALHCWEVHTWADEADRSKCLEDPMIKKTGAELCGLLKINDGNGKADPKALEDCRKNARDLLRVEERTFIYNLAKSKYTDGLAASFSVSNSFGMGKARFTDYGNMVIDAFTVALGAGVSGSVSSPGKRAQVSGSLSLDATGAKNWWSVESNSNRETDDNTFSFSPSVGMSLERLNFELELARHRTCYVVGARKLKVHASNEQRIKSFQGAMLCFEPSNTPRTVRESYYHIFTPEAPTVTIDQSVEKNRIMIPIRGERDYYFFMRNMFLLATPFYRQGVPLEITDILKNQVNRIVQKLPAEPGVYASRAAGRENYEAIPEKIKKMDPFWDPWHDYGNVRVRNINDPEMRRDVITERE